MTINVLNEFLPPAEDIRRGAIKVGETLDIDDNNVLNVDSSAVLGSYYSNVIIEIPQNIKYTLNNGALTIKAGTKTYIPDGFEEDGITKKFREYIVTHDTSYPISHATGTSRLVAISDSNATYGYLAHYWFSGDTAPVVGGSCGWYDTANNVIKISSSDGSSWSTPNVSLPLLGGAYTKDYGFDSIDNVFNGAGYVGHHAYILPGVKGLVADGKDDKGTVKSVIEEVNTVRIHDLTEVFKHSGTATYNNNFLFLDYDNESTKVAPYYSFKNLSELQNLPASFQYIYETNIMYEKESGLEVTWGCLPFIEVSLKDSQVTYFNILQPLRIANTEDRIDTTGTFLFDYKWTDHIPNKLSWIDSSLFSWIDGNVYKGAYEELLTAWNGSYTQKTDNNITYRDTNRGYQIAGPDQEANIINSWNKYRIGWFYILDIPNKRFKLPRFGSKEIVETYQNGTTWYRLYTDDWVEQGGRFTNTARLTTITLPIPMLNNSYYASVMLLHCDSGWTATVNAGVQNGSLTTTSFVAQVWYNNSNTTGLNAWEVKGFSNFNAPTTSSYGPIKHLYFYMGYTDIEELNRTEVDIKAVTTNNINLINTATEEGITRLNTDSNALNRTQITNCLEEIPQNIKLEIVNEVITLKTGSKLYIPNGFESDGTTPKFDEFVLQTDYAFPNDQSTTSIGSYLTGLCESGADRYRQSLNYVFSGPTAPSTSEGGMVVWYDTTNNIIKRWINNAWQVKNYTLPVGITTWSNNIPSINQVFNGFGYIGSSLFALPGIKFLAPNGHNADGTLNNLESTTTKVFTHEMGNLTTNGLGSWIILNADTESMDLRTCTYDEASNTINYLNPYANIGTQCVHILTSAGKVTRFSPKAIVYIPDVTANYYFYEWKGLTAVASAQNYTIKFTCRRGNPIFISFTGDANPIGGSGWADYRLRKNDVLKAIMITDCAGESKNTPFCLTYLDTEVTAGNTYTYNFRIRENGNGTINFQENGDLEAPKIILYEL